MSYFYIIAPRVSIIFGSLVALLSLAGIFGNALVIWAIVGSAEMRRSAMNLLLVNLALADSLFIVSNALAWIPRLLAGTAEWVLPEIMCPMVDYGLHTAVYASILTYMAISIERYLVIVHPMRKYSSAGAHSKEWKQRRNVLILCTAIWVLVAGWWALNAYMTRAWWTMRTGFQGFNSTIMTLSCTLRQSLFPMDPSGNHLYNVYNWLLRLTVWGTYVLAVGSTVVIYWRICRVLWMRNNLIHHHMNAHSGESKLLGRRGIVKMLIVCVTIFLLSYTVMLAISIATMLIVRLPSIHLLRFVPVMANIAMSTCNPYIYTLYSAKFRQRFAQILCMGCRRRITPKTSPAGMGGKSTSIENTPRTRHKKFSCPSMMANQYGVAQKKASTISQLSIPVHTGRVNRDGEGISGKVSLTSMTFLTVD